MSHEEIEVNLQSVTMLQSWMDALFFYTYIPQSSVSVEI